MPKPKKPDIITPQQKRILIRRAAFFCFSAKGYHLTTIDHVCARAKISKGSFYWHYESKQALFLDIMDVWAEEVEGALFARFSDALHGETPFEKMTLALEREARRNRRVVRVWLDSMAQVRQEPVVRAGLARFHRRIRSSIASLLRSTAGSAELSDDDIEALAGCIMACFMGLLCQDQVDPEGASFKKQMSFFMRTLEAMLRSWHGAIEKNRG